MRKQRVVLAQAGAHDQHALQFRQRCDGGAKPASCPCLSRAGEISVTQPVINVLAAQAAHQLNRQIEFFQRAVRADQCADALSPMVRLDLLQAVGDVFQRGLPINGLPLAALLEHRCSQPLAAVERFIGEAVTICNPAFVDGFILKRHHAHDHVVFHLNDQVGTG